MSPRPHIHTEEQILEAAAHVVAQKPQAWTLRDVGDLIGLCPATLVQRFGSKDELELALIRYLNKHDTGQHHSAVGDLITVTCQGDRHLAGLFTFRMLAAQSQNRKLRSLAAGVP